ncbi:hypothetical protein OGAPHI_006981 [Ogataea philodendri]|uniref:Uncharacterized protein n=1 Tax=Ogataea philodendri TaxID=1378263 RepID=A0A9P8T000_9ASCO|nr:uncharacterized protein OGAPHI_006981 [Ogataea philodendri]KAH3660395.1 hypothetical protein OGAPHI_006981 [Ogataea philodendri]
MSHLDRFKVTLNESLDKSQKCLDTLVELRQKKQLDEQDLKNLNVFHKEAVLDNVALINGKNEIKIEYNKLSDASLKKLHSGYHQFNNMKVQRYKGQNLKNESLTAEFTKLIAQIPELRLDPILDDESDESDQAFLKSLRKNALDIRVQFAKSDFSELLDESSVSRVEQILKNEEVRKFRLVQLSDRHYEKERTSLQSMSLKWQNRLSGLTKFIKEDSQKIQQDINSVYDEIRETDALELEEDDELDEDEDELDEENEEEDGEEADEVDATQNEAVEAEQDEELQSDGHEDALGQNGDDENDVASDVEMTNSKPDTPEQGGASDIELEE